MKEFTYIIQDKNGMHARPAGRLATFAKQFSGSFIDQLWARFPAFLEKSLPVNPLKCEYFLPFVVDDQINDGSASVSVLPCEETWYGVTYREDLQSVQQAIADMKARNISPTELWT